MVPRLPVEGVVVVLLVPCPICAEDVEVELAEDDAGRGYRAPHLIDVMNEHVMGVHDMPVSGM